VPKAGKARDELFHYAVVFWQPNKNYGLDFSCAFYPFRLKIFIQ